MSEYIPQKKVKKNPMAAFRDLKWPKLHYMTYVLTFPDGDRWIKQRPFNDLAHEIKQQLLEKSHSKNASEWKNRFYALVRVGETWWKDSMGAEHLMLLEDVKREEKWGVTKEGFATFSNETKYETPTEGN